LPQEFQAVHARHQEVHEQDFRRFVLEQGQRLLTAAGQHGSHAFPVENIAEELAAIRVIVDD
jgi:hypothetical protein